MGEFQSSKFQIVSNVPPVGRWNSSSAVGCQGLGINAAFAFQDSHGTGVPGRRVPLQLGRNIWLGVPRPAAIQTSIRPASFHRGAAFHLQESLGLGAGAALSLQDSHGTVFPGRRVSLRTSRDLGLGVPRLPAVQAPALPTTLHRGSAFHLQEPLGLGAGAAFSFQTNHLPGIHGRCASLHTGRDCRVGVPGDTEIQAPAVPDFFRRCAAFHRPVSVVGMGKPVLGACPHHRPPIPRCPPAGLPRWNERLGDRIEGSRKNGQAGIVVRRLVARDRPRQPSPARRRLQAVVRMGISRDLRR